MTTEQTISNEDEWVLDPSGKVVGVITNNANPARYAPQTSTFVLTDVDPVTGGEHISGWHCPRRRCACTVGVMEYGRLH